MSSTAGSGDNRAISPVIGVVLMVAIVVALASIFGAIALGFEDKLQEPAPAGAYERAYTASGEGNTDDRPFVVITHQFGQSADASNIRIQDDAGNSIYWEDVWTGGPVVKVGESVHIDGFGSDSVLNPICDAGQTYWIIWEDDDGDALTVQKWTVPRDPRLPPGSPSDSDGDGIPNWC
ncbi:type IV pilin [Salinirubrum litoreum]|uniref:Type IV pilin n=1 Tax=Salinirubrum litoreum TaxID=1126234 RepID=A0ABD5REL4_9EURY|nr:type IV pilin N-terminal domain-containing protein [Salinirubrum litoreum]